MSKQKEELFTDDLHKKIFLFQDPAYASRGTLLQTTKYKATSKVNVKSAVKTTQHKHIR